MGFKSNKMGKNNYPAGPPQPAWGQYAPAYQQPYPQYPQYSQPPQPGYIQGPYQQLHFSPRAYEVTFTSWSGRHLRVTEGTHNGPLAYTADLHNRKPHMIFQSNGTANLPATVTFHNFRSIIDIAINGANLPMRSEGTWKHKYGFDSRAVAGTHLVWKEGSGLMNLECTDKKGTLYAKFSAHKGWTGTKAGRLEIFQPAAIGGKWLSDELVVTGLANVYLLLMRAASG